MNILFAGLLSAVQKRIKFNRLYEELSKLDMRLLEDLNFAGLDLRQFAHKVVYGQ